MRRSKKSSEKEKKHQLPLDRAAPKILFKPSLRGRIASPAVFSCPRTPYHSAMRGWLREVTGKRSLLRLTLVVAFASIGGRGFRHWTVGPRLFDNVVLKERETQTAESWRALIPFEIFVGSRDWANETLAVLRLPTPMLCAVLNGRRCN